MSTAIDVRALGAAAVDALRRGDSRAARESFEKVVAAGKADPSTFVGIAFACRAMGDAAAAMDALNRALALEPRNLQALIVKADFLVAGGDARAAAAFYRAAVRAAPSRRDALPAELRREVERAEAAVARFAGEFEGFLEKELAARGLGTDAGSRRFRQSLELLYGRKEIFLQRPRYYYFPELPLIQFFDRQLFPWMDAVESSTAAIRAEAAAVLRDGTAFTPYVESEPNRPRNDQQGMLDNPDWSAFYLWKRGELVAQNAARCPETMRALEHIPLVKVQNRSPSVLFSLLRPGAHIPPHNGMVNTRLICHLPLIVPGQCEFRVGNESREWVEGRAWAFDDTIEHEAWNRSREPRVVMIFEVWRPELTEHERRLVNAMFEAIDTHSGEKPAWEI